MCTIFVLKLRLVPIIWLPKFASLGQGVSRKWTPKNRLISLSDPMFPAINSITGGLKPVLAN